MKRAQDRLSVLVAALFVALLLTLFPLPPLLEPTTPPSCRFPKRPMM